VVRIGALNWATTFLSEERNVQLASAGLMSSLLEFMGIPGAILCAWISDRFLGSRRAPVVAVSLVLLAASVYGLYHVPAGDRATSTVLLGCMGFFTYGPQALLAGVAPVDLSSKRVAAAAIGFTGFVSYLGAAASNPLTGWLRVHYKTWEYAFDFWMAAALLGALLCIPLWRRRPGQGAAQAAK
jgi:OPA family glycerol-3-phosphate transporter-like MFS transporter/OPA family sugar phosphate sensor protein UhpC-like MFS transporter